MSSLAYASAKMVAESDYPKTLSAAECFWPGIYQALKLKS